MRLFHKLFFLIIFFFSTHTINAQVLSVDLSENDTLYLPVIEDINIHLDDYEIDNSKYLHAWNEEGGYRKLKIGNNPESLYSPYVDVIQSGNQFVELVLKDFDGTANWEKIQIRPQGVGTNPITISDYISETINTQDWFTVHIPLSDFSTDIDFTNISQIQFPYSASAYHFDLAIYSIIFGGSDTPYVWLGPGKENNRHSGHGKPGEIYAEWVEGTGNGNPVPELTLSINGELMATSQSLSLAYSWEPSQAGTYTILAEAFANDSSIAMISTTKTIAEKEINHDIGIQISSPANNTSFLAGDQIKISTVLQGIAQDETYILVTSLDGYRKLKLGYDPDNIYSPKVNVIESGNNSLHLELKDFDNNTDWERIQCRPDGSRANPVSLSDYMDLAVDLGNGWFSLDIPLSDFDPEIDFTAISWIEIPYSRDEEEFRIGMRRIEFTGGSEPFLWFGPGKTDNSFNGDGGPGSLLAELIQSEGTGESVQEVDFYMNSELVYQDYNAPYEYLYSSNLEGNFTIYASLITDNYQSYSDTVNIQILDERNHNPIISDISPKDSAYVLMGQSIKISGKAIDPEDALKSFELWVQHVKLTESTDSVITYDFLADTEGILEYYFVAEDDFGNRSISESRHILSITPEINPSYVNLIQPVEDLVHIVPDSIPAGIELSFPEVVQDYYLEVSNPYGGYRKLKIANNPESHYRPYIDVLKDGNNTLELVIKDFNGKVDWNRILVCPMEVLTNPVSLSDYIQEAIPLENDWFRVKIPLSDFDASIDFANINFMAFPYSRNAGDFVIGLKEIAFTGGQEPYLWFGPGKMDNHISGDGEPGQLSAEFVNTADQQYEVDYVEYYLNNHLVDQVSTDPYSTKVYYEETGSFELEAICKLSSGGFISSGKKTIQTENHIPTRDKIEIVLSFDTKPENFSLQKAKLKYNKGFAYSLSFDDSYADAYNHVYKILNGGYVEENNSNYPGYHYTDGCGNDVSFKAGLAWISVNGDGNDLHINTPNYITWEQLEELFNDGWDVFNHSYSHANGDGTDYQAEIQNNQTAIYEHLGFRPSHFVIPSGDKNYIPYAWENGMRAIYAYTSSFSGYPDGIDVTNAMALDTIKIYRRLLYDSSYGPENITEKLDEADMYAENGMNLWFSDFTHRVSFSDKAASLHFDTFAFYMSEIHRKYGKNGKDNMWMAPNQEVYEYLYTRDHSTILTQWEGNDLRIIIDVSQVPFDFRRYALSILPNCDQDFRITSKSSNANFTYVGSGENKLINLEWVTPELSGTKSETLIPKETKSLRETSIRIYPNPFRYTLHVDYNSDRETEARISLLDLTGRTVLSKKARINEGLNHIELEPQNKIKPGLYILKINDNNQEWHKKVLFK